MADGFTTTRSVPMPVRWGEKRYHSLDYALKSQFGEKSTGCIKRGDDLPQPGWKDWPGRLYLL